MFTTQYRQRWFPPQATGALLASGQDHTLLRCALAAPWCTRNKLGQGQGQGGVGFRDGRNRGKRERNLFVQAQIPSVWALVCLVSYALLFA